MKTFLGSLAVLLSLAALAFGIYLLKFRVLATAAPPQEARPTSIYQFELTLLGIKLKIWRRIQIPDCKLHNLHLHIQAAMGWRNSHFHHFDIKGERHGLPEHLDYDGDGSIIDSKKIQVSPRFTASKMSPRRDRIGVAGCESLNDRSLH